MAAIAGVKRGKAGRASTGASSLPGEVNLAESQRVLIALIRSNRFNPRQSFPAAEIAELAATMQAHGLLEPVVLRPLPTTADAAYELVAGERRLRAAKRLGWQEISATIRELTDAEAREICLLENLQRKDLNAIEQARGFRMLLQAGAEITQIELAQRLGCTQGHISNRLRLLELPQAVQERIISGEIPPGLARGLLPYKAHPRLLEAVAEQLDEQSWPRRGRGKPRAKAEAGGEEENGKLPIEAWALNGAIDGALGKVGRELERYGRWDGKSGATLPPFKPTAAQREALQIVRAPASAFARDEEYALNVKLYVKLKTEHDQAARAAAEKKHKGKAKKAGTPFSPPPAVPIYVAEGGGRRAEKEKPLTPAQKKAEAAAEAKRKKEQKALFRKRLAGWAVHWKRWLIARLVRQELETADLIRLALLAWDWTPGRWSAEGRCPGATDALAEALATDRRRRGGYWAVLAGLDAVAVEESARAAVARCFWIDAPEAGPNRVVPPEDVAAIAADLDIELEAEWLNDQAGPLSESYWNLHTREQLLDLARELKYFSEGKVSADPPRAVCASMSKAEMVKAFLAARPGPQSKEAGLALPKELRERKA